MSMFTVIDGERAVEVEARIEGERVLLDPAAVKDALGWEYHDGQLCSDMMCIPIADVAALLRDGAIELGGLARALDRPLALDVAERAACLGASARERAEALASQSAPDFTLPDLDGRPHTLSSYRGKKILLVAWASW
jgi:redoxin